MKVAFLVAAVAATTLISMAAPAHAVSDQQIRYMSDVDQHDSFDGLNQIADTLAKIHRTLTDILDERDAYWDDLLPS